MSEEEVSLIGNVMWLAVLVGYSLGLAASVRAILFMKKEAQRVEQEELVCGYLGRSTRAVKPDPDGTAAGVATWAGMWLLIVISVLLMNNPVYLFVGDMDSTVSVGFAGVLLCALPFMFFYVSAGGYDLAIFSDEGILIRVLPTREESSISWAKVEKLYYTTNEGSFLQYRLKIGKLSCAVNPRGERSKIIMELVVKHVPRTRWEGEDLDTYLESHFGIVSVGPSDEPKSRPGA